MNNTKDYQSNMITWEDTDCIHIENQEINEMYKRRERGEEKKRLHVFEDFGVAAGQERKGWVGWWGAGKCVVVGVT